MAKEVTLTPAQFEELQNLILASQDVQSQASTTSFTLQLNGTEMEYAPDEVKFTLSEAE